MELNLLTIKKKKEMKLKYMLLRLKYRSYRGKIEEEKYNFFSHDEEKQLDLARLGLAHCQEDHINPFNILGHWLVHFQGSNHLAGY